MGRKSLADFLRNSSTIWWNVATVKQYMVTTEDRMGDRNTRFLWELWGKYGQTAMQQSSGSVCAKECTIGGE